MLEAAIAHFNEKLVIEMQMNNPDGSDVQFILTESADE